MKLNPNKISQSPREEFYVYDQDCSAAITQLMNARGNEKKTEAVWTRFEREIQLPNMKTWTSSEFRHMGFFAGRDSTILVPVGWRKRAEADGFVVAEIEGTHMADVVPMRPHVLTLEDVEMARKWAEEHFDF